MANETLQSRLPKTTSYLPDSLYSCQPEELLNILKVQANLLRKYPFIIELAEIELLLDRLAAHPPSQPKAVDSWQVAPGVELLEASWSGFPDLLSGKSDTLKKKKSHLLILPKTASDTPRAVTAGKNDLLALKIVSEKLNLRELALELGVPVDQLQHVLNLAVTNRIILKPPSKICRSKNFCSDTSGFHNFLKAEVFTLQWHITQICDLKCRHCYDRTQREQVSLEQGNEILDQFYSFCDQHNVDGQVSFSGGNPLLHPFFFELYQAARDRGFRTAILGNPTTRHNLERILKIQMPEFYQVSLEGMSQHNDYIRGDGHFQRTLKFLEFLKDLNIYSMVMLTLTRANQEQVLPLTEILRNKVDSFTFNRLAMVGEGASLDSADIRDYSNFLQAYEKAAEGNPIMRLKENLFNLIHLQKGIKATGGCTGYGCGAAFNFVSLLPDGQVHACRKFPSLLGSINQLDFSTIYWNKSAAKYRKGSSACFRCKIRPICGGCLAVTYGFGKDPLSDLDPYCFIQE